jgi:hypothetical protein
MKTFSGLPVFKFPQRCSCGPNCSGTWRRVAACLLPDVSRSHLQWWKVQFVIVIEHSSQWVDSKRRVPIAHFKISARESLLSRHKYFLPTTISALQAVWSWRNLRIADLHDSLLAKCYYEDETSGGGGGEKWVRGFGGES